MTRPQVRVLSGAQKEDVQRVIFSADFDLSRPATGSVGVPDHFRSVRRDDTGASPTYEWSTPPVAQKVKVHLARLGALVRPYRREGSAATIPRRAMRRTSSQRDDRHRPVRSRKPRGSRRSRGWEVRSQRTPPGSPGAVARRSARSTTHDPHVGFATRLLRKCWSRLTSHTRSAEKSDFRMRIRTRRPRLARKPTTGMKAECLRSGGRSQLVRAARTQTR